MSIVLPALSPPSEAIVVKSVSSLLNVLAISTLYRIQSIIKAEKQAIMSGIKS
jgi:hypothetical protein